MDRFIEAAAAAMEGAAAIVLLYGGAAAFLSLVWRAARGRVSHGARRDTWLGLARWIVLSLEFQLAADVLHTSVAPTWTEIGRVAALALIRTFLNHALETDLEKASRAGGEGAAERPAAG
ncbi:MAG TPA: DUF1622 domain-containing protein [Longimicrobium sp.]|nr:DUF1622 domain-containing protein [Longimicrobium sp.]